MNKIHLELSQLLNKKKIIIFGSSGGLGRCVVKILKKFDCNLFLFNKKKINFLKKNSEILIKKNLIKLDPDIIINCSGILGDNKDHFEKTFRVNFMPSWEMIKFYKNYKIKKKILLIIIGSSAYKKGRKKYILYSSSKAALHNMVQGANEYILNKKFKLAIYHPNRIDTKMVKHLIRQKTENRLSPFTVANKIIQIIKKKY